MNHSLIEKSESDIAGLSLPLRALWHAAHDHWDQAHQLVQDDSSSDCAWVHAYLHRVECDISNAHYWYRQAGKTPATGISLEQELSELIAAMSK
jgi:hypothetical protein